MQTTQATIDLKDVPTFKNMMNCFNGIIYVKLELAILSFSAFSNSSTPGLDCHILNSDFPFFCLGESPAPIPKTFKLPEVGNASWRPDKPKSRTIFATYSYRLYEIFDTDLKGM